MTAVWPLWRIPASFPDWVRQRYPSGIKELEKVNNRSSRFWAYAWQCIESAEKARAWQRALEDGQVDPNEAARQLDVEYLRSVPRMAQAARQIANHIDLYPFKAAAALGRALLDLKEASGTVPLLNRTSNEDEVNPFGYGPGTVPDVIANILRNYAAALDEMPLAKVGPFIHRFQFGALKFDTPIDRRSARPGLTSTSLLFELALFGRHFTAGEPVRLMRGIRMPDAGRPIWPVVVALLGDALDEHLTEHDAQDRLAKLQKRNTGVSWAGWPDLPERYLDTPHPDTWF